MKKTIFIKNATLVSATGVLLRLAGMIWRVWLAGRLGSQTLGLFQLVLSVTAVAGVAAVAGLPTAVTRLASEAPAQVASLLRRCLFLALTLSLTGAVLLNRSARLIAIYWLHDARTVPALRVGGAALPFMAVSGVLRGWLTARRKAMPCSLSLLIEQAVRIIAGRFVLTRTALSPEKACAALYLIDAVAEACACAFLIAVCLPLRPAKTGKTLPWRSIRRINTPLTAGRYLTTALRAAETSLLTTLLSLADGGAQALAGLGVLRGMALPLLLFPASLLGGISGLLVPELAEANSRRQPLRVRGAVAASLRLTAAFGVICGVFFTLSGPALGRLLYHAESAGQLIVRLAPLTPLFYLDSLCVGLLCGLDCQTFTTLTAAADGVLRLALTALLVPRFGLDGFVTVMYVSNGLTAGMHLLRLFAASRYRPEPAALLRCWPVAAVAVALLTPCAARCTPFAALCLSAAAAVSLAVWFWFFGDLRPYFSGAKPCRPSFS